MARSADDTRRYELPGVGSVRFTSGWKPDAVAEAPGHGAWRLTGRALLRARTTALDASGAEVASFVTGSGRIVFGDRELTVAVPDHGILARHPPYELVEDGRVLARIGPQRWGGEPVEVEVLDEEAVRRDPLLLLFAAFGAHLRAVSRYARAINGADVP